jgi:hypothetical protein
LARCSSTCHRIAKIPNSEDAMKSTGVNRR